MFLILLIIASLCENKLWLNSAVNTLMQCIYDECPMFYAAMCVTFYRGLSHNFSPGDGQKSCVPAYISIFLQLFVDGRLQYFTADVIAANRENTYLY